VYDETERATLASELARAVLVGQWTAVEVAERGAGCLDRWPQWMSALSLRVLAVHRSPPVERPHELVALIEEFLAEHAAGPEDVEPPRIIRLERDARAARPARAARRARTHDWPIADIGSVGELAARLELSDGQLAWLADVRALERTVPDERLRNYRYAAVPRRSGLPRVIEAPKARLKELQRWVLREVLDHVPPHDAAHGFTRGRSVISHARLHTGRGAIVRLDLSDFFASIAAARVFGIFRTLGYAPAVAHVLTGLCTNTVPQSVWLALPRSADPHLVQRRFWFGRQLATPHLPQGAPTSPAMANLAAFRLDRRLTGLAESWGLRYSRYADDLTFSGPSTLLRSTGRLGAAVSAIAREEGFAINPRKSIVRSAASRQSVCGVVVNVSPNVARTEYDRLKAVLHNAARYGPDSQNHDAVPNFEAHLRGRIAWVSSLHPDRGEMLRRRFAQIDWGR
jgi:hypothetical protein